MEQKSKAKAKSEEEEQEYAEAQTQTEAEAASNEASDLLDDIDEILEENAEEFVRGYVQKGGE